MQDVEVKKSLNIISFREGNITAVSEILCDADKIKINLAWGHFLGAQSSIVTFEPK